MGLLISSLVERGQPLARPSLNTSTMDVGRPSEGVRVLEDKGGV